jgi:hypothetical protein
MASEFKFNPESSGPFIVEKLLPNHRKMSEYEPKAKAVGRLIRNEAEIKHIGAGHIPRYVFRNLDEGVFMPKPTFDNRFNTGHDVGWTARALGDQEPTAFARLTKPKLKAVGVTPNVAVANIVVADGQLSGENEDHIAMAMLLSLNEFEDAETLEARVPLTDNDTTAWLYTLGLSVDGQPEIGRWPYHVATEIPEHRLTGKVGLAKLAIHETYPVVGNVGFA